MRSKQILLTLFATSLLFLGGCSPTPSESVEELDGTLDGTTLAYPIDLSFDTPTDENGNQMWQYYKDDNGENGYRVELSMYYEDGYVPNFYRDNTISFIIFATYVGSSINDCDNDGDVYIEPIPSYYTETNLLSDRKTYRCVTGKNHDLEYLSKGYGYEVRFSLLFPELGSYRIGLSFFQHSTCKSYASRLYDVILEEAPDSANGGMIIFKLSK